MPYDPNRHHRRSIRLRGYDYRQSGVYFVTICTERHHPLFGQVDDGAMQLNFWGRIADTYMQRLLNRPDHITLDAWVVMPNHVHMLVMLNEENPIHRERDVPLDSPETLSHQSGCSTPEFTGDPTALACLPRMPQLSSRSLGAIVSTMKSVITRGSIGFVRHRERAFSGGTTTNIPCAIT